MEIESRNAPARQGQATQPPCAECLGPAEQSVVARGGATLCAECAEGYYAPCAACGLLVARDEAVAKESRLFCAECDAAAAPFVAPEDVPDDATVESLVAEYVALHEELKRLDTRASEIKEQLKRAATARPRVSNAVVLRAGEAGVRCGYASKATYDPEKLSEVERLLGAEGFAALFERKVTFSAVKNRLEEFLSSDDPTAAPARDAVRAAETRTEVATLTVVAARKKKS